MLLDVQQNTPEWLALRREKIGASDAPIIMGVSPWTTPRQLWETKVGLREPQETTERMQRGHDLEPVARAEFMRQTGIPVHSCVLRHRTHKWMIASLDGLDLERSVVVEIKCPGKRDHESALDGVVPDKYLPQLQHQMEVAEVNTLYYFSFDGKHGKYIIVEYDREYCTKMLDQEQEFYDCMTSLRSPPLMDKDYEGRDDEEFLAAMQEYSQTLPYVDRNEAARLKVISLSRGRNCVGGGFKVTHSLRKGNVDYKAIPELERVDLESYRKKPSDVWRISTI